MEFSIYRRRYHGLTSHFSGPAKPPAEKHVMKQRHWHIEGHDSFEKIYDKKVKLGCFSENQIKDLVKALTAKAAFNFDEIVGAYAKKTTNRIKRQGAIQ